MTSDDSDPLFNRREAIVRVSALLGGAALTGGSGLLAAVSRAATKPAAPTGLFTQQDIDLLDEIAETILPATKTPGAKAAHTGAFMALMVTDCYSPAEQRTFRDGMGKLEAATRRMAGASFMTATPEQRLAVLTVLDQEQKHVMDAREAADRKRKGLAPRIESEAAAKPDAFVEDQRKQQVADAALQPGTGAKQPAHYFRMMKELSLLGYFTSEIGCTQAQRYIETPGRYDSCVPYESGSPSWAPHA